MFNKGAIFGGVVALFAVSVLLFRDRISAPNWVLIVAYFALALLALTFVIRRVIARTRDLAAVAQRMGWQFAATETAAAFGVFAATSDPAAEHKAFDEAIAALGTPPTPQVKALLDARFAKARTKEGVGRTILRQLKLVHDNLNPRASHVMTGRLNGLDALICDYSYNNNSQDSSATIQTIAAFQIPGRALPSFEMSPQTFLHSVASAVGFQDINFPAQPEFSKRFLLRGQEETAIRALFTPSVLHALQSLDERFDLTVEGAGDCLAVYKPRREVAPDAIPAFAERASAIAAAFRR
ncbi:MAG TPA: hypothetical protein VM166_11930 [Gemmatimonadaceae bacterium]|nr:hypothetical protein [Gemmatimonadaceae bacterium]